MTISRSESLPIRSSGDVVVIRQRVRSAAEDVRFSIVGLTKLVTAASELARNTLVYGGGGNMLLEEVHESGRTGLRLTFADNGPGIADIALALKDGYTTGQGLGLGLGGARRLSDEFHIDSAPGKGTTVCITRWK